MGDCRNRPKQRAGALLTVLCPTNQSQVWHCQPSSAPQEIATRGSRPNMPDERGEAMRAVIDNMANNYFAKHGHYPARARVGSAVAHFFLKAGERRARIAIRPGTTTLWVTVIADERIGPSYIVVEG